jgi:hypothetical protein
VRAVSIPQTFETMLQVLRDHEQKKVRRCFKPVAMGYPPGNRRVHHLLDGHQGLALPYVASPASATGSVIVKVVPEPTVLCTDT